jgi:hypothetical protein
LTISRRIATVYIATVLIATVLIATVLIATVQQGSRWAARGVWSRLRDQNSAIGNSPTLHMAVCTRQALADFTGSMI